MKVKVEKRNSKSEKRKKISASLRLCGKTWPRRSAALQKLETLLTRKQSLYSGVIVESGPPSRGAREGSRREAGSENSLDAVGAGF